jgi:hypothetical protein
MSQRQLKPIATSGQPRDVLSMTSQKLPTLYIPHGGGPCFFMDWNPADT